MIFGKIDYLNLLPFHIFLKRYRLQNSLKMAINFKRGVPSKLCRELAFRRIDAAVISSVESRRFKTLELGICAKKSVKSVLVRKNSPHKLDPASKSSNMLAAILGLKGEIIIGDAALRAFLADGEEQFFDMATQWSDKTGLPFVFGRFSYIKYKNSYRKIIKNFLKQKIFIPRYILNSYSNSRKVSPNDILWYLKHIYYTIGPKEQKSLNIFLNRARRLGFNPNVATELDLKSK